MRHRLPFSYQELWESPAKLNEAEPGSLGGLTLCCHPQYLAPRPRRPPRRCHIWAKYLGSPGWCLGGNPPTMAQQAQEAMDRVKVKPWAGGWMGRQAGSRTPEPGRQSGSLGFPPHPAPHRPDRGAQPMTEVDLLCWGPRSDDRAPKCLDRAWPLERGAPPRGRAEQASCRTPSSSPNSAGSHDG